MYEMYRGSMIIVLTLVDQNFGKNNSFQEILVPFRDKDHTFRLQSTISRDPP